MQALLTRIQAYLKRKIPSQKENTLHIANLSIHDDEKNVYKDGELLNFFIKEKLLLFFLIEQTKKVVNIEQLISHVWGYNGVAESKTDSVHISTLRRKMEDIPAKPKWIQTVRGFGYPFVSQK
ncbi:response regulator transcription factor [Lysinibacillus fusiformis]|nr:response regulator transcription factor [Lysinibacillus fusiformis]